MDADSPTDDRPATTPHRSRAAVRSEHPQVHAALSALGERLRNARVVRDIPLAEMARRMGVQQGTLSRLEHGAPGVSMQTLALALWHLNLLEQFHQVCAPGTDPEGDRLAQLRQPSRARGRRLGGGGWDNLKKL